MLILELTPNYWFLREIVSRDLKNRKNVKIFNFYKITGLWAYMQAPCRVECQHLQLLKKREKCFFENFDLCAKSLRAILIIGKNFEIFNFVKIMGWVWNIPGYAYARTHRKQYLEKGKKMFFWRIFISARNYFARFVNFEKKMKIFGLEPLKKRWKFLDWKLIPEKFRAKKFFFLTN